MANWGRPALEQAEQTESQAEQRNETGAPVWSSSYPEGGDHERRSERIASVPRGLHAIRRALRSPRHSGALEAVQGVDGAARAIRPGFYQARDRARRPRYHGAGEMPL